MSTAGSVMHTCEWCGTEWRSPISAALCCDEASNALHDDHRPERYYLSEN